MGVTLCPDYIDYDSIPRLIKDYWNITQSDNSDRYNYYQSYLIAITESNFKNLSGFDKYKNDTDLNRIDKLRAAWEVCNSEQMQLRLISIFAINSTIEYFVAETKNISVK